MKRILFLLCATWSSQALPMIEPQHQNSAEDTLAFEIHQPFLSEFIFNKMYDSLHHERRHCYEIHGKALNGDPKNEHLILRNFTIIILLIPQSSQIVSVEASIRPNGHIFSGSFTEPANINIKFNYQSNVKTNLLDNCITQLLDIALLFEHDEILWICEKCKKQLWHQEAPGADVIVNQHYLSEQGQFYCEKCNKQDSSQLTNSITIPFESYRHISSLIELAQSYGGIW